MANQGPTGSTEGGPATPQEQQRRTRTLQVEQTLA